MPPVGRSGSGAAVEPSTAALNPMATPWAPVKRTTCSTGMPSDPVIRLDREVTV